MMKKYIKPTIEIVNIEIQPLLQASSKGKDYKKDDPVLSPRFHQPYEEDEEEEEDW